MRRFSDELVQKEDREFEVGGELFRWRYPFWKDWTARMESDTKSAGQVDKNGNPVKEDGTALTFEDIYQDYFDRIETFLDTENGAVTRWKALAKRKEDPVPPHLLPAIYTWLVRSTSGLPTEQPSPSQNGQGQTEPSSTEESS